MSRHSIRARRPGGEPRELERLIDADSLAPYLEDAAHAAGGHAAALVHPRDEHGVAQALATSGTVLAIGAQSSLTGGATPRGETLLSTRGLRTIADTFDGGLRVGAGITIAEIDAWLRRRGALYPPGPTWQGATLGGTIATNAAGAATFKYGTTRTWVDALTVVLASGDVLDVRRGETTSHPDGYFDIQLERGMVRVRVPRYRMPEVPKLSAGYFARPGMDLIDLFIGAEGTLGVVTEATLRVLPDRPAVCLAFVTLRDRASALALVGRLRDASMETWRSHSSTGLDISAIEHMDARSLSLVREDGVDRRLGIALDAQAAMGLLIAIDLPAGTTAEETYDAFASGYDAGVGPGTGHAWTDQPLARFSSLLQEYGVADETLIAAPGDAAGAERLLALREAVPLAVNRRIGEAHRDIDTRIEKTAADVIVPFDRFEAILDLYEGELRSRGLDGAIWGHISDGNVHPNVLPRSVADLESGREAVRAFGRAAIQMGGAPLAEHGVGRSSIKQQLLVDLYGEAGVGQMRAVKRALDPQGKLAPGVIFSPS